MIDFRTYPKTFFSLASHEETFACYDGSTGRSLLDAGHLAKVLRVRGVLRETGNGWGSGTSPYQAQSLSELRSTLKLRASR